MGDQLVERLRGASQALGRPELADIEARLPVLAREPGRPRADLHEPALATDQVVGVIRPGREADRDPEAIRQQVSVRVGLHDRHRRRAEPARAAAGDRRDHRPCRRVITADREELYVWVDAEDQIAGPLGDRQRRDRQVARVGFVRVDRARDPGAGRGRDQIVVQQLRDHEHVADVDDAPGLLRRAPAGVLRQQRATHRLRPEVRAATKAGADVRGDAEHDDLCVRDRVDLGRERGVYRGLVGDAVERALHRQLLGAAGRDEVQAAAGGAQQQTELGLRGARHGQDDKPPGGLPEPSRGPHDADLPPRIDEIYTAMTRAQNLPDTPRPAPPGCQVGVRAS